MALLILRIALLFGLLCIPVRPAGAQSSVDEYSLKAVFMLNFCRFITWPEKSFSSASSPIVIGIVGGDPFGRQLDSVTKNEQSAGRRIRIERYSNSQGIGTPHLLFIGRDAMGNLDAILGAMSGKSTVLVGEGRSFIQRGGMIAFTVENNRVQISINQAGIRSANLSVSSKLLRVAR